MFTINFRSSLGIEGFPVFIISKLDTIPVNDVYHTLFVYDKFQKFVGSRKDHVSFFLFGAGASLSLHFSISFSLSIVNCDQSSFITV